MVSMTVGGRESAEGDTERQEGERGIVNVLERERERGLFADRCQVTGKSQ